MKRKCVCCGSDNLLRDLKLMDRTRNGETNAKVRIDTDPLALIFKGAARAEISAEVCDDCGHLQLFIPYRREIKEAHDMRVNNSSPDSSYADYIFCSNCSTEHDQEDCPKCGYSKED